MKYDILDYCPEGFDLRPNQIDILKQVQDLWEKYKVIIISAPVGSGKSLIAQTIARWRAAMEESTATITPRVTLQDQYQDDFPTVPTLKGKARYKCGTDMTCADHHEIYGNYCDTCPFVKDKARCSDSSNSVYNFHSYILGNMHKDNLIVDEAHNIFPIMGDMFSTTIWKHKHFYPDSLNEILDVSIWLEKVANTTLAEISELEKEFKSIRKGAKHAKKLPKVVRDAYKRYSALTKNYNKYTMVLRGINNAPSNFFIEHGEELYKQELKPCLKIRPTTLRGMPEILWPQPQTKKIVMMSGTISELDIGYMGLHGLRTAIIKAPNPIPAENRPFIVDNAINMSYKYQDKNVPKMAKKISEILDVHSDTKGLIHTTYGLSKKLRKCLGKNDRLMWHTSEDKEDVLEAFLESKGNKVLVACGFSEGIDLKGEDYGFQMITKVQWPSKADKLIAFLYNSDIKRILWDTARIVLQQYGRICRGADDYGVTYMLDSAFGNVKTKRQGLYQNTTEHWDKSVTDAIEWR